MAKTPEKQFEREKVWVDKPEAWLNKEMLSMPFIDLPFTRLTEHWMTHQSTKCADYELDWNRCLSRVGMKRGETECVKFEQDLLECIGNTKSRQRWVVMHNERARQKKSYAEVPPPDSWPGEYNTKQSI